MFRLITAAALCAGVLCCGGSSARADVYDKFDLTYQTISGMDSVSGEVTLDVTALAGQTGVLDVASYASSLTLAETGPIEAATYSLSDYVSLIYDPIGTVDFGQDLVPQLSDLNFEGSGDLSAVGNFTLVSPGGTFRLISATPETTATPTPEPTTLAVFGAGLAGLSAARRRRRAG